jgi:hypothetical protein
MMRRSNCGDGAFWEAVPGAPHHCGDGWHVGDRSAVRNPFCAEGAKVIACGRNDMALVSCRQNT